MDEPRQPRILISRLSAIGDVIHSLPVVCALRDHYPQATIGWVVEGRAGDLLEGHPAINHLHRVPRKWLKSLSAVRELRNSLKMVRYDLTIDTQGLTKSAIAARLSGAFRRIGFAAPAGRELSSWFNNELMLPSSRHVIDRNLELLKHLGIYQPPVKYRLPESPETLGKVTKALRELNLLPEHYMVINPGAGWPSKLWPTDRFAEVAKYVGAAYKLPSLVVWAGEEERKMAEQIVAGSGGHARMAPATSLTELSGILRRARIMVAADTGPLHLSVAVGTPSVGLFGPMPVDRNGPYGPKHIGLQVECLEGTSRERRNATNSTMRAINVHMVTAACEELLERPQPLHHPASRVA